MDATFILICACVGVACFTLGLPAGRRGRERTGMGLKESGETVERLEAMMKRLGG